MTSEIRLTELGEAWSSLPTLRTKDADVARAHLQSALTAHDMILQRSRKGLEFIHSQISPGSVTFGILGYGADVEINNPQIPDFYLLQLTLAGSCHIRSRGWEAELSPGSLFVMNPMVPYQKIWSADCRQFQIKIPTAVLQRYYRNEANDHVARELHFCSTPVLDDRLSDPIVRLIGGLFADLRDPHGLWQSRSVLRQMESTLISAVLRFVPNDQSSRMAEGLSPAVPGYVRRAEEFIRANLSEVHNLAEVAQNVGVSARTLQEGFRRFRGTTPAAFVREARLEYARRELLGAAASRLGVTQIALASGFGHLGRFAGLYESRFGEAPSATLRRTRSND